VEIPLLSILPPPEVVPAARAKFPELEIVSEPATTPAKSDLPLAMQAVPDLTLLADPASHDAIPDLAPTVETDSAPTDVSPLRSLQKADLPDLGFAQEPVSRGLLPDLSVVSAPTQAPATTTLTFAPDAAQPVDLVRELARLQDERDSVVAQLDEHSAVSARERAELEREHEDIVATLMAEHEAALAKLRAEHATALNEFARKQSDEASEASLKPTQSAGALAEELPAVAEAAQRLATMQARLDWQDRSLAFFEEEVETYRRRIKTVLQERDALQAQLGAEKEHLTRRHETNNQSIAAVKERLAQLSVLTGEIIHQVHALSVDEAAVTERPSSDNPVAPNSAVLEAKP
jgi:ABC-type phosphate transport system auxiliary subunit